MIQNQKAHQPSDQFNPDWQRCQSIIFGDVLEDELLRFFKGLSLEKFNQIIDERLVILTDQPQNTDHFIHKPDLPSLCEVLELAEDLNVGRGLSATFQGCTVPHHHSNSLVSIIGIEVQPTRRKRLSFELTESLIDRGADYKAFVQLIPYTRCPKSLIISWGVYNTNVYIISYAHLKRSLMIEYENLEQYSDEQLNNFTLGELELLKIAARGAQDVRHFYKKLDLFKDISRRYGEHEYIPPVAQYTTNRYWIALLVCKLQLFLYREGQLGLEHLIAQLKSEVP